MCVCLFVCVYVCINGFAFVCHPHFQVPISLSLSRKISKFSFVFVRIFLHRSLDGVITFESERTNKNKKLKRIRLSFGENCKWNEVKQKRVMFLVFSLCCFSKRRKRNCIQTEGVPKALDS